MRPRKSRASAADRPPPTAAEARTLALDWLGLRDLSRAQLRHRLTRRGLDAAAAEAVVADMVARGYLDEARLATATARHEAAIKGRGPARVRAKLRALGLGSTTVERALDESRAEIDSDVLLDRAIAKRLRTAPAGRLDSATLRRVVAALVRQGFDVGAVFARLRRRGADVDDDVE